MGLFNFRRKQTVKNKSAEEQFREKIREAFESSAEKAISNLSGDSFMDGLMVQAAIGSVRKSLLEQPELQVVGLMARDWSPELIIDEECNRVLNKYLVR